MTAHPSLWTIKYFLIVVSTHNRAKAAEQVHLTVAGLSKRFNTQPREGDWADSGGDRCAQSCFNTRPREGGWLSLKGGIELRASVSTHSRAKAAGHINRRFGATQTSFNTQPREGGWIDLIKSVNYFHVFQHTAARRRLGDNVASGG